MKLEKILIGVLLLVVAWLVLHKQPTLPTEIRYITKLEQKLDTLYRYTIVFKTKIRRFKDTIIIYRDSVIIACLLYTSPSPRDGLLSRMPSSA